MKARTAIATLAAVGLGACATGPGAEGSGSGSVGNGMCNADGAQTFVGQRATAEAGTALLRTTGARQLRWVPPRTAVTMDFRPDRLTVSYDDNYTIERVSCG